MAEWDYIAADPLSKLVEALRALPRYSATITTSGGRVVVTPCVTLEALTAAIQSAIATPNDVKSHTEDSQR